MIQLSNKTIVVWFSCGAASAVAAKKTIEIYGQRNAIRIVNNPILEEDADNQRFLKDVEKWLGLPIEYAINPKYPNHSIVEVFNKRKYMSGVAGAPCTQELKKGARKHWEENNKFDYLVLGFTVDEKKRHDRFILTERSNVLPVLIDANLTKDDCFKILLSEGIKLPEIYSKGFPNANCIGCVKSSSPNYWAIVKREFPEVFKQRAEQSRKIGCKLLKDKNKRIFLDELPQDFIPKKMKANKIECGIFCEEKA